MGIKKIMEQKFIEAMEKISLLISEVLKEEKLEDLDEILINTDTELKHRILHYEHQNSKINDKYIELWYHQGFKDGFEYGQKKNN